MADDSKPQTRQRDVTYPLGRGRSDYGTRPVGSSKEPTQVPNHTPLVTVTVKGTQKTVSEGNPVSKIIPGNTDDIGSEFYTINRVAQLFGKDIHLFSIDRPFGSSIEYVHKYAGPIAPLDPRKVSFPPDLSSSDDMLDEFGATAISRCEPTNSVADLSTAFGEIIKDGLPKLANLHLWKSRTSTARKASGEYLNQVFTNLPFLSEVKDTLKGVSRANELLAQYERDAGTVVRRRYDFPLERSETTSKPFTQEYPFIFSGMHLDRWPASNPGWGPVTRRRVTTKKRWFAGAFTYYLPYDYNSRSTVERYGLLADKILGAELTPETVWELAPWSWAVDWFSNAGDVVKNVSSYATNGLIMRYGYVMETTMTVDTYTHDLDRLKTGQPCGILEMVTITKKRRKANPFGFGVSWEGLSPFQLSIIAALGISRKR